MIIFLYGENTYLAREKLKKIIEAFKTKNPKSLVLRTFNLKETNFSEIKEEIKTTPLFLEKRIFLFKDSFVNKSFQESFLREAEYFLNSKSIFIFFEEGLPPKGRFFDFLKEKVKTQEFKILQGKDLEEWVKKEFAKYNFLITREDIEKLVSLIGNDLWRFSNEIKKIVCFNRKIDHETLELLVSPQIEVDIFKTIDAIAAKNKKLALFLINKHLAKGDNPLYLFSMINFQFRNLLAVKELLEKREPFYNILKISQLHPFFLKKLCFLANKFTLAELKRIYQKIFQADFEIKTGKIKAEQILDLLIVEL
jgi:DNA polymerase-3 subunit delta